MPRSRSSSGMVLVMTVGLALGCGGGGPGGLTPDAAGAGRVDGARDTRPEGSAAADPGCEDVARLRLSDLAVDSQAAAGGTAEVHVDVSTVSDQGVASYPGAVLACDELGTLVTSIDGDGAWFYAVLPTRPNRARFSVHVGAQAPKGAIAHCRARAAILAARDCTDAHTLGVDLVIQ